MKTIFEPTVRKELIARANRITLNSPRLFGTMRPDQGLHHINSALRLYTGEITSPYNNNPVIKTIAKLVTFSPIPIPRGKGRTAPPLVSNDSYDLEKEKRDFSELIEKVGALKSKTEWPVHPFFGKLSRDQYGKLGYKHTDHHLQQFGV